MTAVAWLLVIAAAAHGYGYVLAELLRLELSTRLERATVRMGLGAGLLVLGAFAVGLLHLVGRPASLVMVLPAAGFTCWKLVRSAPRPLAAETSPRRLRLVLSITIGACVAANVLGTLAPPSFVDALVYHLFIGRTYLGAGGIVELPSIWQSYQPLGMEMLFTLGLSLQGPVLAALTHTALGVLAACATTLLGRRIAGPLGGLLAAAIFYCTAIIAWESTSCFVELGITAFGALGSYAFLRWSDDEKPCWLIATAFLLGLAGTCKLTAIQFAVIAAGLAGWMSWRRGRRLGVVLGRIATLAGIALGLCLPWYVQSYLWTGNPIYPFATKVFGPNSEYEAIWGILTYYGAGHGFKDLLLAPWNLFSRGALFEGAQYFSPLPFMLGPVILLRLRRARDRQILFAAASASFALWLGSAHIARYLIPLQPLLAVLAADALCWLGAGTRYQRRLALITGAVFVGFGALTSVLVFKSLAPVVLGRESVDAYLSRTAVSYNIYKQVMEDVPANGLILTNQGPTFYLDRPHVRVHDAEFSDGPERVARLLTGARYTHILVHGHEGMEKSVMGLGARVRLLWNREFDMPLSRTFGGTLKMPAALFEIVR
jgi:hypothetical protein